jgi:hypothetical protein
MRFIYFPPMAVLLWSYWRALKRARDERTPFTPLMGWLIGLGYFAIAPLTILVVHGGYQMPEFYQANERYASVDLSDGRYAIPMAVVLLALFITFQVVALLKPPQDSGWKPRDLLFDEQGLRRAILLTFSLSVLDWAFTIWRAGGLESFLISHWYLRQEQSFAQFGELFVVYAQLSLANQIVFTAAAALFTTRQLQLRKLDLRFSVLLGLALVLQMVMSGNRIFIALYGLAFLTACWTYARKRLIARLLLVSPALLLVFSAWGYFRHDLSNVADNLPVYVEQDLGNRVMSTLMDTTEGTSVMLLLHIVNDFGDKFDYFYGLTYSKAITFIVPRRIYPNKPDGFTVQVAKLYEPGEVTSLATTQLGELYANFGVFVLVLLPFFTVLIWLLSVKLAGRIEKNALLLAILFLLMIWFARTSLADNFITFLFAMLLMRGFRLQRGLCLPIPARPILQTATT